MGGAYTFQPNLHGAGPEVPRNSGTNHKEVKVVFSITTICAVMTLAASSKPFGETGIPIPPDLGAVETQVHSLAHNEEKFGLRTLGDGPIASGAAEESAEAADDDLDIEIAPGRKGWLDLVGVSPDM